MPAVNYRAIELESPIWFEYPRSATAHRYQEQEVRRSKWEPNSKRPWRLIKIEGIPNFNWTFEYNLERIKDTAIIRWGEQQWPRHLFFEPEDNGDEVDSLSARKQYRSFPQDTQKLRLLQRTAQVCLPGVIFQRPWELQLCQPDYLDRLAGTALCGHQAACLREPDQLDQAPRSKGVTRQRQTLRLNIKQRELWQKRLLNDCHLAPFSH